MKNKLAFTLAEVLITLGIIGVVAALTIPSLVNNYHKKQYYTQFMKARSILENAKRAYDDEDGSIHEYDVGPESYYSPLIESMAKHNKGELIKDLSKITSYEVKNLNGEIFAETDYFSSDCAVPVNIMFETIDGIDFIYCSAWYGNGVFVDINGYKNKPNTIGRDIFFIKDMNSDEQASANSILWNGTNGKWKDGCSNPKEDDGFTCAGRLLEKGKMDY